MRNIFKILIVLFSSFVFWSCENDLKQPVKFEVTASTASGALSGNAFSVAPGTPVKFNFTGDPDFITFFSGETGHEYSKRNLLETPVNEITSTLKFTAKPQYGVIPGTLKVLLSTNFTGLIGMPVTNKKADSLAVAKEQWINITDACTLPTVSNGTADAAVPLNDYLGKKLTIAFRYKTDQNTGVQPTWIITNLKIENKTTSGAVSSLMAGTMGFKALDMLSTTTPYKNDGGAGFWDLRNVARTSPDPEIRVASSPIGSPINDDWAISNPILINSRPGDTGVGIKKLAIDINTYTYTFNTAGTYVVTFVARNANYQASSEIVKEFTVTVK